MNHARKNGAHQSEAQLEKRLIEVLISQGYEYLPIHTQEDLLTNPAYAN